MRSLTLYLILASLAVFSQEHGLNWPIDSPHVITGNYGELRPNHFHAGMDFSTNGQVNHEVFAAEEGYVSRIRVSPVGYGKSVYITHPNGLVTVYGHLNSFSLKIDKVVRQQQEELQSYEVEILQRPGIMPVRKNEIIGLSGNTGGSTGPHLHFEIRDAVTETPLNPFLFYRMTDTTKPEIDHIGIYNLSDTCSPRFIRGFAIRAKDTDSNMYRQLIEVDKSILGVAFSASDKLFPRGNPNNVYSAKLFFDDQLVYSHRLKGIDFADARYVNEFSETVDRIKYQKCFIPTLYPAKLYPDGCYGKGRIILEDTLIHFLKLVVCDERGNERSLGFRLRAVALNAFSEPNIKSRLFAFCDRDFKETSDGVTLYIPANTLYYSTPVILENTLEGTGKLIVLPTGLNLRSAATVIFKVPPPLQRNKEKLVLINGRVVTPGKFNSDSVFFQVKNFGWMQLSSDTIPPRIRTSLKLKKIKRLRNFKSFSFLVTDYLSGISRYSLFINGKWTLAEYDAKYDLLTYYFDEKTPAGPLQFRVEATDQVGNSSVFEFALRR